MEIAIRKLTSESLNDWLDYFDNPYHGPVSMYEKAGFVKAGEIEGCIVFRKKL